MANIPYDVTPGTPIRGMKFEANLANLEAQQKEQSAIKKILVAGVKSATVPLAALTIGGTQGKLVITDGVITEVVNPT